MRELTRDQAFAVVMHGPEGPRYHVYRRSLSRYVDSLAMVQRLSILSRRSTITRRYIEWTEYNAMVLRALDFNEGEVELLKGRRLNSPGMRELIRVRYENKSLSGLVVDFGRDAFTVLRRVVSSGGEVDCYPEWAVLFELDRRKAREVRRQKSSLVREYIKEHSGEAIF